MSDARFQEAAQSELSDTPAEGAYLENLRHDNYNEYILPPSDGFSFPEGANADTLHALDSALQIVEERFGPDSFDDKVLLAKSPDARRFEESLTATEVIERLPVFQQAVDEVMFAAWERSIDLRARRAQDPGARLDMPVAAMLIHKDGEPVTPVIVSNDNESGNAGNHAEQRVLNHLARSIGVKMGPHRRDIIAVVSQDCCYGCTGVLYMHQVQGIITGSHNNGIAGVTELYSRSKQTSHEINVDHMRQRRTDYATDWTMDWGLIGYQRALHLGIRRNSDTAEVEIDDDPRLETAGIWGASMQLADSSNRIWLPPEFNNGRFEPDEY